MDATTQPSMTAAEQAPVPTYSATELEQIRREARSARWEFDAWTAGQRADAVVYFRKLADELLMAREILVSAIAKATADLIEAPVTLH